MAGVKISALPPVGSALVTDIFPIVQAGVTSKESVSQLITLLNTSLTGYVPISGGTMTGPLILSGNPTLALGAATKQYVDMFASGITVILATQAATTANLNAIYANGAAGVGATLTNNGAMAAFAVDGYSANLNDRILVKNQTTTFQNGVYSVTTVGSGAVNWVLTRTTDYDLAPSQIKPGTLVAVNNGTANATTSWLETATVTTIGVDPILFSQFTFAPSSFLLKANNLSDVASVAASLVNLGLGVPTGTGNVVLQTSPTLITPTLGNATATSLTFSPTTSGIVGTPTNDNAAAGKVGEFISSVIPFASAVSLTNAVPANVTSISLSAGDWDVWGNISFNNSANSLNSVSGWISTTSATLPDSSLFNQLANNAVSLVSPGITVPQLRFSVAGPTTVFLSTDCGFSSGTLKACGGIYARRVR
jgi:hypothetical protein